MPVLPAAHRRGQHQGRDGGLHRRRHRRRPSRTRTAGQPGAHLPADVTVTRLPGRDRHRDRPGADRPQPRRLQPGRAGRSTRVHVLRPAPDTRGSPPARRHRVSERRASSRRSSGCSATASRPSSRPPSGRVHRRRHRRAAALPARPPRALALVLVGLLGPAAVVRGLRRRPLAALEVHPAGVAGLGRLVWSCPAAAAGRPSPRQAAADLLELGAGGHLLGVDRGLDAVEEALEPADQLGLGDPQLALGGRLVLGERQRSRSSSSTSSGARPASSSLMEAWWISLSRLRLASSSGAAFTSSSSWRIMLPIRITLAGCSTRSVMRARRSSSSPSAADLGADAGTADRLPSGRRSRRRSCSGSARSGPTCAVMRPRRGSSTASAFLGMTAQPVEGSPTCGRSAFGGTRECSRTPCGLGAGHRTLLRIPPGTRDSSKQRSVRREPACWGRVAEAG